MGTGEQAVPYDEVDAKAWYLVSLDPARHGHGVYPIPMLLINHQSSIISPPVYE